MHPAHRSCLLLLVFFLMGALALVPAATAQSFLRENKPVTEVSLEWIKPVFSEPGGLSFFSSVAYATARVAFTPQFAVIGSLPVAHFGLDTDVGNVSETDPGNGYLGFQFYAPARTWRIGAGAHLPLAADDASALGIGFLADYDHLEAYIPDALTVSAEGAAFYGQNTGLRAEGMLRPAMLLRTGGGDADHEFLVHYGARGWLGLDPVHLGLGFSGVTIVSEEDLGFNERSAYHATLYVTGDLGNIRPGVFLRLPIDEEIGEDVDFIFGLGVTFELEE